MTIQRAKDMIHQLANHLTAVMGALDMSQAVPADSVEWIKKARAAAKQSAALLRQLSHLLASIAEEAHTAAIRAAHEAQAAADAAAVAVEQSKQLRNAAAELERKSNEVKEKLKEEFRLPGKFRK
jgi:hypothetical protein